MPALPTPSLNTSPRMYCMNNLGAAGHLHRWPENGDTCYWYWFLLFRLRHFQYARPIFQSLHCRIIFLLLLVISSVECIGWCVRRSYFAVWSRVWSVSAVRLSSIAWCCWWLLEFNRECHESCQKYDLFFHDFLWWKIIFIDIVSM